MTRISKVSLETWLALVTFIVFVSGLIGTSQFSAVSSWFPILTTSAGTLVSALVLFSSMRHGPTTDTGDFVDASTLVENVEGVDIPDDAMEHEEPKPKETRKDVVIEFVRYFGWLSALAIGMVFLGAPLAIFAWLFAFLKLESKEKTLWALIACAITVTVVVCVSGFLAVQVPFGSLIPSGIIINWIF